MEESLEARNLSERLEEVRGLLIAHPDRFSLETAGEALARVSTGLATLQMRLEEGERQSRPLTREDRQELAKLFSLTGRVSALYHQAMSLYEGGYEG